MRIVVALLLASSLLLLYLGVLGGLLYFAYIGQIWPVPLLVVFLLISGYFAFRDPTGWGV